MCITATCADPTSPGVWWRDDAEWKQYDAVQAAAIQKAVAAGALKVELGNLVSSKYAGGARYVVDLTTMKQTNLASSFQRDVKIIKPPKTSTAAVDETVMKELEACKKTILSLTNMVHKLNVDVLALKLHLAKSNAKRFEANISPTKFAAGDPKCEGVKCEEAQEQSLIDDFEDGLLSSDDDVLYSGSFGYKLPA